MIDKRTVIDQIVVTREGPVLVRFALEFFDADTGETLSHTWHRTSIAPGDDPAQVIKFVNEDITVRPTLRANPVSGPLLKVLPDIVDVAHTDAVVKAWKERVAEQLRALGSDPDQGSSTVGGAA